MNMDRQTGTSAPAVKPRDLLSERDFIETLLCERFNFLLLFYSLVVAGALQTTQPRTFAAILGLGALICTMLAFSIARSQLKLDLILDEVKETCPNDPSVLQDQWANDSARFKRACVPCYARWPVRQSRRRIVGYLIPLVCYLSLWLGAIAGWCEILKP